MDMECLSEMKLRSEGISQGLCSDDGEPATKKPTADALHPNRWPTEQPMTDVIPLLRQPCVILFKETER
jgi:hypothetical protein